MAGLLVSVCLSTVLLYACVHSPQEGVSQKKGVGTGGEPTPQSPRGPRDRHQRHLLCPPGGRLCSEERAGYQNLRFRVCLIAASLLERIGGRLPLNSGILGAGDSLWRWRSGGTTPSRIN